MFERLRQELPYEIEVKAVGQRVLADGSLRFDQTVIVPTEMVGLQCFDSPFSLFSRGLNFKHKRV